jgi:hypothetical protein
MSNYAKYMSRGLEIMERSKKEDRDMTPEEYARTRELFDRAQVEEDTERTMKGLGPINRNVSFVDGSSPSTGRLGDLVASK